MTPYQDHPIATIFPLMEPAQLQELADDIKQHGLENDVLIYEGKILDGRNRYRACALAGIPVTTCVYAGDDPVGKVLSLNLHRRHLTPSQKGMIGQASLPHFEAEAKKRQGARNDIRAILPECSKGKATEQVAQLVGVSPRYISDAKRIKAEAPELAEKVQAGEITIPQAIKEIKAAHVRPIPPISLTPEQQSEVEEAAKDSHELFALKRAWRAAGKRDRKIFLEWCNSN